MMTQKNSIAVLFFFCILSMLSCTVSAYGPLTHACCVKYTRKPLPFHLIKGFIEQSSMEVCRIDAIIFFTVKDKKVCANAKDEWVQAILTCLSDKLNAIASNGTLEISEGRKCQPLKKITN